MTSIRLTDSMETKLARLCAATKRSKSFFIKEALERYLEDIADAAIATDRITRPGRKLFSTKEILRALESRK